MGLKDKNIINDWLAKNGNPKIEKQVETEAKDQIKKAFQMEDKKQQKYDEMLAMLEKHLIFHNGEMEGLEQPSSEMWFELYEKTEQLIKEAKEL